MCSLSVASGDVFFLPKWITPSSLPPQLQEYIKTELFKGFVTRPSVAGAGLQITSKLTHSMIISCFTSKILEALSRLTGEN